MNVVKFGQAIGFVCLICAVLLMSDNAVASGGGWGGGSWGGGSRGFVGGSWGGGSRGFVGGSWGAGSRGVFVARPTPVRNMLGRMRYRVATRWGGSRGYGSGGSTGSYASLGSVGTTYVSTPVSVGYASGGSWGSSYAYTSSGAAYGSWGSSYLSTVGSSYNGTTVTAPIANGYDSSLGMPYGYSNSGIIDSGIPIEAPGFPYESGGTTIENGGVYGGGFSTPGVEGPRSIIDEGGVVPEGRGIEPGGIETAPTPRPSEDAEETMILPRAKNNAVLSLNLPLDAKVYINDQLTKTEGEVRDYVSRRLKHGEQYEYHVKAVVNRDGHEIVRTHSVKLRPGIKKLVTFNFEKPAVTTLALKVPANAKVKLSGNDTSARGRTRYYETRTLKDGQVWKDYKILVSVVRNGKTVIQEKTIDIESGQTRLVSFDFTSEQVVTK